MLFFFSFWCPLQGPPLKDPYEGSFEASLIKCPTHNRLHKTSKRTIEHKQMHANKHTNEQSNAIQAHKQPHNQTDKTLKSLLHQYKTSLHMSTTQITTLPCHPRNDGHDILLVLKNTKHTTFGHLDLHCPCLSCVGVCSYLI